MSVLENRQRNAPAKIAAIVELITEELRIYPGDEAMRLLQKLLEILDSEER